MSLSVRIRRSMLSVGTLGVLCALTGCANETHATAPIGWSRGEITSIAPHQPSEQGSAMSWTATSIGPVTAAMASRRNASLVPPPPAPITATSVWPGPGIPTESRRLPIIYSRWGRSF